MLAESIVPDTCILRQTRILGSRNWITDPNPAFFVSGFQDAKKILSFARIIREFIEVSAVRYDRIQCCGSGMFIPDPTFSNPDPGSVFFHPGSRICIKEFEYFNQKNCFQALGI
jgi:hypothetical protein